jgi:hypothetical protein
MSKIAIVEDGKVTYRGKLPTNFRNSNMNCTGLDKATPESLIKKGILPLEIVPPVYDSTTHKIDGFTDTIQKGKVVQAWNIVERTQADADNDLDSEYREKIEDEKGEDGHDEEKEKIVWHCYCPLFQPSPEMIASL